MMTLTVKREADMSDSPVPVNYRLYGPLYSSWARALSFVIATLLSLAILVMPQLVATDTAALKHGPLSLGMVGISIGFVHGVGYVPQMTVWRWLFSPYLGWPVMACCIWWWLVPLLSG